MNRTQNKTQTQRALAMLVEQMHLDEVAEALAILERFADPAMTAAEVQAVIDHHERLADLWYDVMDRGFHDD
jgi:hypothetical protein